MLDDKGKERAECRNHRSRHEEDRCDRRGSFLPALPTGQIHRDRHHSAARGHVKDDLFIAPAKAHQDAQVPSGRTAAVTFHLKLRPFPLISTPDPKIVVVKHTYQGKPKPGVKPHRIPVKLSFEGDHDGDGEFNSNHAGNIVVFEKGR